MCNKVVIENRGMLGFFPDYYKDKKICDKDVDICSSGWKFVSNCFQAQTMCNNVVGTYPCQPARNIPGIFAECSLNVEMFETYREHLGNILKEKII